MKIQFEFLEHREGNLAVLKEIAHLKATHWEYNLEQQLKWMDANLCSSDVHLLLRDDSGRLFGYANLVEVEVTSDSRQFHIWGLGNVCVAPADRGKKYGYLLMNLVNYWLYRHKKSGALLCHDELKGFYQKCGWALFDGEVFYRHEKFLNCFMISEPLPDSRISFLRNF